jgi:hypothetical protein
MTRPISITIVAWVIIALSLEGLFGTASGLLPSLYSSGALHTTLSVPATLWVGAVTLTIYIGLAALMLAGFGWARIVYVCLLTLSLVGLLLQRQPFVLAIMIGAKLSVFSYFLFRKEANIYFSTTNVAEGLTSASSGRDA